MPGARHSYDRSTHLSPSHGDDHFATAYVPLAAAFSIFGDQLGWLWRVSISAPIGTAAIAVLLLSRERLGSSLAIFGVELIGYGVALIVDNRLAVGVATIGLGVVNIGYSFAEIRRFRETGRVLRGCPLRLAMPGKFDLNQLLLIPHERG